MSLWFSWECLQVERRVQETLQLHQVSVLVPSSWSCCGLTTSIPEKETDILKGRSQQRHSREISYLVQTDSLDGSSVVGGGADAGLNVAVVALVLVLFLTPHQISIYVSIGLFFHQIKWEW